MPLKPQDIRFGIEIETTRLSREQCARAIHSVVGGELIHYGMRVQMEDGRIWKAVSDGSIRSTNGRSAEVVSPICHYSDIEQVQQIVRALRAAGARVNSSCGIHVHCDFGAFSHDGKNAAKTVRNLAKMVHKNDELITAALGISATRRDIWDGWCWYTKTSFVDAISNERNLTLERLRAHWYAQPGRGNRGTCEYGSTSHYNGSRYHGLNLHNIWFRGTVEFRWFEATLHAGEVKSYIQLCVCLAAKALNSRSASAAKRPVRTESSKYDFRCFLLELGMKGDEFKTARLHLTKNLTGDTAYKGERPEGR